VGGQVVNRRPASISTDYGSLSWTVGITDRRGRVVNTPAAYRRPAILTEVFRGFPQSSGKCRDTTVKVGHCRFLPYPFQFIINVSSFHSTLYSQR
jgi:hypothetical protein